MRNWNLFNNLIHFFSAVFSEDFNFLFYFIFFIFSIIILLLDREQANSSVVLSLSFLARSIIFLHDQDTTARTTPNNLIVPT